MTVELEVVTVIDAPLEVAFDLAIDIDAHLGSQAGANERAVGGVTSGRIGLGQTVTWRATHFGIPFTMTSRIAELDRPHVFVDEQVKGPFHRFHHRHLFEPDGDGTRMTDQVRFTAPVGPIGVLVEKAVLGRYLERLIADRGQYLKAEAESQAAG